MNGSEKQINGVLECILIELREMAQEMADNSMWYHGFKEMTFQSCIYNALLDGFEEGMTVEKLKPSFDKLKNDDNYYVKGAALYSIGAIKHPKALQILTDALKMPSAGDSWILPAHKKILKKYYWFI